MASIEELTRQSRVAILANVMDAGRAVTPEQYVARERIAELEAALRPLAEACLAEMGDGRETDEPDDGSVFAGEPDGQGITFGMIRRAMAALANSKV